MRSTQNIVGVSNIFVFGMENFIPVRAARRLAEGGIPAMNRILLKFLFLGIPIVGGVLVVAAVGAEFWLDFLYGEEFSGYGYLVVWWSAIHFMSFLIMPLIVGLRTLEMTKPLFQINLVLMVLTLATFYPLIRYGGIPGAMIGATVVEAIRLSYLFHALRKASRTP
jgi:O-antigen/teichoic acid export membrane protein